MAEKLGCETYGGGSERVIIMHDWFGDRRNWEGIRSCLTPELFTYAFIDLRGYGESRRISGLYSLEEAAMDVIASAESLGWKRYAVVGHSMSSLVMQRMLQLVPERITRAVAVTPVAPTSMRMDAGMIEMSKKLALATDERRLLALRDFWGTRLSDGWIKFKVKRWSESAERDAAAAYVDMYGSTDISKAALGIKTPMLIIGAELDAPPFHAEGLKKSMLPYYPNAQVTTFAESGHYPMQEQPPLFATVLERFLSGKT